MAQPPVQPSSRRVHRGVVGLVPAAGSATRLGPLPCSKEVLPLPAFGDATAHDGHTAVRPAIAHLLDCFVEGGVTRAFVVVRDDKWDVPRALRASGCGVDLAYVVVGETPSPVHTLARAAPFVRDQVVALGFPDILFAPRHAYGPLLDRLLSGTADVVLGLFPTEQCDKTDMVELADFSEATGGGVAVVRDLVIKQPPRGLRYTWSIACWRPRFTEVLVKAAAAAPRADLHVGEVLRTAIARGVQVEAVPFAGGSYLDIGTPEDLLRAMAGRW